MRYRRLLLPTLKEAPSDAKEFEGMEGKFEKYFSKEPGSGD